MTTPETCAICIDDITNDLYRTGCQHSFHRKCLEKYVEYNQAHLLPVICPLCGMKFEIVVKTNSLYKKCSNYYPQLTVISVVVSLIILGTFLIYFLK
jgi:hypothetical protein